MVIFCKTGFIYKTTGIFVISEILNVLNLSIIEEVFFSKMSYLDIVAELTKMINCPRYFIRGNISTSSFFKIFLFVDN